MFSGQLATGSTSSIHQNVFVKACESYPVAIDIVRLQVVPLSGSECKGQVKRNRYQVKVMEGKDRKRFFLCCASSSCYPSLSLAFWYIVLVSEVVSWKWWLPFLLASPVASDRFDYNYRCYSTRKTEVFASLRNSYRTLQHVAKKHSFLLNTD